MTSLKFNCILFGFLMLYIVKCAQGAKIVGGTITTINHHMHQVYLRKNGSFFCGGSLIDELHVVTAAHCVSGLRDVVVAAHGGTSYLNEQGVLRKADKILVPKLYDTPPNDMDIALIKLRSPMVGKNVKPIGLYTGQVPDNAPVVVTGWGVTNQSFIHGPNQLRRATVRIVNRDLCKKQYGSTAITATMLCASINGIKDTCQGDSGGPLVYQGKLAGVTSWGDGCAQKDKPGIYAAIGSKRIRNFLTKALTF